MKLYHGTSSIHILSIKEQGLKDPFLTDSYEIAQYYASCSCDEVGGKSYIIELEVSEDSLLYDGAAMDEPVLASEELRDLMWKKAKEKHPEWIQYGYLVIPEHSYIYSLRGVNSVRTKGIFYPILD